MTTVIQTYAQKAAIDDKNQYRVFFRVVHGQGSTPTRAIDIRIREHREAPEKLAELLAIKWVLYCGVLICNFYSSLFFV